MVDCGCDLFLTAFFTFVGYSVLKKTKTKFLRWMCFMFFISAFSGLLFNFDYLWLIYGGAAEFGLLNCWPTRVGFAT